MSVSMHCFAKMISEMVKFVLCYNIQVPSVWCPSPGALPTNYPDPDPSNWWT